MDFVVTAVTDTVIATSVDKTPRKCLYLSRPGSTNIDDVWVEGIGSLVGGVRGAYVLLSAGAIPMLRTCKQDGQTQKQHLMTAIGYGFQDMHIKLIIMMI